MNDFATAGNGCHHFLAVLLIQVFDRLVRCHDEGVMVQWNAGAFHFPIAWVVIHPDLEVVTKTRIVMVIEQHSLLACVAIPPLVL